MGAEKKRNSSIKKKEILMTSKLLAGFVILLPNFVHAEIPQFMKPTIDGYDNRAVCVGTGYFSGVLGAYKTDPSKFKKLFSDDSDLTVKVYTEPLHLEVTAPEKIPIIVGAIKYEHLTAEYSDDSGTVRCIQALSKKAKDYFAFEDEVKKMNSPAKFECWGNGGWPLSENINDKKWVYFSASDITSLLINKKPLKRQINKGEPVISISIAYNLNEERPSVNLTAQWHRRKDFFDSFLGLGTFFRAFRTDAYSFSTSGDLGSKMDPLVLNLNHSPSGGGYVECSYSSPEVRI